MGRPKDKNNHSCSGYWLIDSQNVGECIKLYPNKDLTGCVCCDTGEPCPYDGVKDFGERRHKSKSLRQAWKASLGGRRRHGLE